MSIDRHRQPRGIAMLLVLISLAMATILATAYLASRDNSLPLSRNAAASARARWAALSAQQTALAVLQTQTTWRTMHGSDGVLLKDTLAGADIQIEARDLETGNVTTGTTRYARVTASAEVDQDGDGAKDGREQATILAYVPVITGDYAVVDLSDFSVFAKDWLSLNDHALIARWPEAPLSALGRRIALGTRATTSNSIRVLDSADCVDCTIYDQATASPTLVNNASGPPIAEHEMGFAMHFPPGPLPGEIVTGSPSSLELTGGSHLYNIDKRFSRVVLSGTAQVTLRGSIKFIVHQNLELFDDARLIIDGNVKLVVFNDVLIRPSSAIELLPGARLAFYIDEDLKITDGYIGDRRGNDDRDATGHAPHTDVNAVQIFSFNPPDEPWYLHYNSVVKGNIYGTLVDLQILGDSALYGRVAAKSVMLADNGAIFYDHAIDQRQGFTNPQSPLYLGSTFNPALAPASLDPLLLQIMATATMTFLRANAVDYVPAVLPPPPPPPPPGSPTPRPVQVDYTMESFGVDTRQWETSGTGG